MIFLLRISHLSRRQMCRVTHRNTYDGESYSLCTLPSSRESQEKSMKRVGLVSILSSNYDVVNADTYEKGCSSSEEAWYL